MHRGEVYWMNVESNVEHINKGFRPVLIVSNDICNETSQVVTVVPLTTADKKFMPTHVVTYVNGIKNTILCEHVMPVNKDDIKPFNKFAELSRGTMDLVSVALMTQLGIMGC